MAAAETSLTRLFIGGSQVETKQVHMIRSPWDGSVVGETAWGYAQHAKAAIAAAERAMASPIPDHRRARILESVAESMRKLARIVAVLVIAESAPLFCNDFAQSESTSPKATPESVNMDAGPMAALSQEFETGKLPNVDSMMVIRCGEEVFYRTYSHDYGKLYYNEAHTRGPLNARLTGIYNYFDPQYHPFY